MNDQTRVIPWEELSGACDKSFIAPRDDVKNTYKRTSVLVSGEYDVTKRALMEDVGRNKQTREAFAIGCIGIRRNRCKKEALICVSLFPIYGYRRGEFPTIIHEIYNIFAL